MAFALEPELTHELKQWGLEKTHLEAVRLCCEQKDLSNVTKPRLAETLVKVMSGLNANFRGICKFFEAVSPKKKNVSFAALEFSSTLESNAATSSQKNDDKTAAEAGPSATKTKTTVDSGTNTTNKVEEPASQGSSDNVARSGSNKSEKSPAATGKKSDDQQEEKKSLGPKKAKKSEEICRYYKLGRCTYGISGKTSDDGSVCRYAHPKKCSKFMRFAHESGGCPLRHSECSMLHPIVCYHAKHGRVCHNRECTLLHPSGLAYEQGQSQGNEERAPLSQPPRFQTRYQSQGGHASSAPQMASSTGPQMAPPSAPKMASAPPAADTRDRSFLDKVEQMQSAFQDQLRVMQKSLQDMQSSQWLFQQQIQQQLNQPTYRNQASQPSTPPGFMQKPSVPMPGTVQSVF